MYVKWISRLRVRRWDRSREMWRMKRRPPPAAPDTRAVVERFDQFVLPFVNQISERCGSAVTSDYSWPLHTFRFAGEVGLHLFYRNVCVTGRVQFSGTVQAAGKSEWKNDSFGLCSYGSTTVIPERVYHGATREHTTTVCYCFYQNAWESCRRRKSGKTAQSGFSEKPERVWRARDVVVRGRRATGSAGRRGARWESNRIRHDDGGGGGGVSFEGSERSSARRNTSVPTRRFGRALRERAVKCAKPFNSTSRVLNI